MAAQNDDPIKRSAELTRLFRTLNHDVKSPLHAIETLSSMYCEDPESFSPEEKQSFVFEINRSVHGINETVAGIMHWLDYHRTRDELPRIETDVSLAVAEAIRMVQSSLQSKNIELIRELPADGKDVTEYKGSLAQIVRALLSNAIKYSHAGGKAILRVQESDSASSILIEVEDFGVGLDEQVRDGLFDYTKRTMKEGTSGEKGAGLGLLLARDIAQQNSASLDVFPKEGPGALFRLVWPVRIEQNP